MAFTRAVTPIFMSDLISFTPDSTHAQLVTYSPSLRHLSVTFHNGRTYTHTNVPLDIYTRSSKVRSFGSYYHGSIKSRYKLLESK